MRSHFDFDKVILEIIRLCFILRFYYIRIVLHCYIISEIHKFVIVTF